MKNLRPIIMGLSKNRFNL